MDVQRATEGSHDEKQCKLKLKLARLRREEDWSSPPALSPDPQQDEVCDQQGSRKRKREAAHAGPSTVDLEQKVADMLSGDSVPGVTPAVRACSEGADGICGACVK